MEILPPDVAVSFIATVGGQSKSLFFESVEGPDPLFTLVEFDAGRDAGETGHRLMDPLPFSELLWWSLIPG